MAPVENNPALLCVRLLVATAALYNMPESRHVAAPRFWPQVMYVCWGSWCESARVEVKNPLVQPADESWCSQTCLASVSTLNIHADKKGAAFAASTRGEVLVDTHNTRHHVSAVARKRRQSFAKQVVQNLQMLDHRQQTGESPQPSRPSPWPSPPFPFPLCSRCAVCASAFSPHAPAPAVAQSIDYHEKGKKHLEAVQEALKDVS